MEIKDMDLGQLIDCIRNIHENYGRLDTWRKSTAVMNVFWAARRLVELLDDDVERAKIKNDIKNS